MKNSKNKNSLENELDDAKYRLYKICKKKSIAEAFYKLIYYIKELRYAKELDHFLEEKSEELNNLEVTSISGIILLKDGYEINILERFKKSGYSKLSLLYFLTLEKMDIPIHDIASKVKKIVQYCIDNDILEGLSETVFGLFFIEKGNEKENSLLAKKVFLLNPETSESFAYRIFDKYKEFLPYFIEICEANVDSDNVDNPFILYKGGYVPECWLVDRINERPLDYFHAVVSFSNEKSLSPKVKKAIDNAKKRY